MIYDCFPFNNELMLLEIRLNHHSPFVDKFILSEATHTYSGKPKELYYDKVKNQEPFAQFKDKIIHRVYDVPPNGKSNWDYEHDQRDSLRGFEFKDDDLILYLDCDEMIRDGVVIEKAKRHWRVVTLGLKLCWYYFNCIKSEDSKFHNDYSLEKCFEHGWYMGKICRKSHLEEYKHLYNIRQDYLWNRDMGVTISEAGWHFSNLGKPQDIYDKLMAFSHSEELSSKYKLSPELIQERKEALVDPLGREEVFFNKTDLDVPFFISDNIERYRECILDA